MQNSGSLTHYLDSCIYTIAQYIVTCPILELCMESYKKMGYQVSKRWWDQGGLDLDGVREEGRSA